MRLSTEGYNELPSARPRNVFTITFGILREPMLLLLLAASLLYSLLGDIAEALLLLASSFFVVGINLYQERRTERALEALRDLSSPRALVIRDGTRLRVPGREVVRGDLFVLSEGDRVPADAVLLSSLNLSIDESLLTGESASVQKVAGATTTVMLAPGGDDQRFVYSGTLVVQGQGIAEALAIGAETSLGRIGKSLQTLQVEQTQVQLETRRVVSLLASLAVALCILVSVVYGLTHDWQSGFLTGITLAMAIIPEEFPVVLSVFLGLGAWRLSRQRVLTRRVPAVETLGSATVLCVDKTGTLTLNQMAVQRVFTHGTFYEVDAVAAAVSDEVRELAELSLLASQSDPFDPMERAIKQWEASSHGNSDREHEGWSLVREYPLSPALLALSHFWRSPDGPESLIAAKGAPEAIMDLCHLDAQTSSALGLEVERMAADGLRVLGVAKARFTAPVLPENQHDFEFTFAGLLGLMDPLRPSVSEAIEECHRAGIRVVMITGDHAATARHIGAAAGLRGVDNLMLGSELADLSDVEIQRRVQEVNIFARMVPQQKLRLVNALKANGEIVAMTGDGVNDAPALKAAHIGVAMGSRGTDVAREAASLVLLDDDFSSIVKAVRLGRGVYDNLRKAIAYLLAVHVPITGLSLLPVLLQTPLVLLPAHVVFLELIIDPACSIAFEAEPMRPDVMTRPPRGIKERLFSAGTVGVSMLQGGSALVIVLAVYAISGAFDSDEARARAMTFTTLVFVNLMLILSNRSTSRSLRATLRVHNPAFWWVTAGALVLLSAVLLEPHLQDLFRFELLKPWELAVCLAAAALSLFWFESLKLVRRPGSRADAPHRRQ